MEQETGNDTGNLARVFVGVYGQRSVLGNIELPLDESAHRIVDESVDGAPVLFRQDDAVI